MPRPPFPPGSPFVISITYQGEELNRIDDMLRFGDQPWGEQDGQTGPDPRDTDDLFRVFIGTLLTSRTDIYEGNVQAEARKPNRIPPPTAMNP